MDKDAKSEAERFSLEQSSALTELHRAIGQALSAWANLEYNLGDTYAKIAHPESKTAALAAYWSNPSFLAKLEMVRAVFEVALKGTVHEVYDEWLDVHKRLIQQNKLRNRIAHGTAVMSSKEKNGRQIGGASFFPKPNEATKDFLEGRQPSEMHARDIVRAAEDFGLTSRRLRDISDFRVFRNYKKPA